MKMPPIPDHWSWKTLSKLGTSGKPAVKAGPFGSSLKKEFYVASGFRVYGQEQVIANNLSLGNYYIDEKKFKDLQSCEVKAGDILVSLVGTFGKSLVVPHVFEPGIINPRLVRLSLDSNLIDPHFFSLFFQSPLAQFQLDLCSHGGTMNIVNAKNISELLVPLPPIKEQKRIAEVLDRAEELRSKRWEAIAQLDTLTQAIFLEMFGDVVKNQKNWKTDRMENLMRIRRGGSPRPIEKYLGGDINWIKIGDGTKGSDIYLESCAVKITRDGLSKTVFLEKGSLIFANCGVSLGFARILKIDGCIHDGWLSFDDIDEIKLDKLFLLKALNSITNHFRAIAPDGTQPNLNTGLMKNFLMILPPLSLQQEFACRVEAVEKLKAAHRASLSELDALFTSLQHRAFRGEL